MLNGYAILADLIVFIHMLYVFFTVGGETAIVLGGIFRWRWIRNRVFRIVHLVAVVIVSVESLVGVLCPITEWEHQLRRMAGQDVEEDITFIGRLIRLIVFYEFPDWAFSVMYIGFGVLVVLTVFLIPPYWKKKGGSSKQTAPP
jgi:hypothetical protein